jgi:hypothetical protein
LTVFGCSGDVQTSPSSKAALQSVSDKETELTKTGGNPSRGVRGIGAPKSIKGKLANQPIGKEQ